MVETSRHDEFMQLFLPNQTRIYAYIRTLVFDRNDAEEVLQEVASVLWRKFDEFVAGTRFDQWAYAVAYHQVLYYFQRKRRQAMLLDHDVLASVAEQAALESDQLAERRDALEACLEQLPEKDRQLIRQRFQADATNRSVARATGRSESAISRALNRIYDALLNCIQTRLEPG